MTQTIKQRRTLGDFSSKNHAKEIEKIACKKAGSLLEFLVSKLNNLEWKK